MTRPTAQRKSPARPGSFSSAARVLLLACGIQAAPALAADGDGWQLSLRSSHHSDASALARSSDLHGRDLAPRSGRNLAYIDDEARLTRDSGAWHWSLLARSRATLVASHDALDLYRHLDSGSALTGARDWATRARLRGFSGNGLAVGRGHEMGGGWAASWELQSLVLSRWRERRVDGAVSADAVSGRYAFALHSSQADNRLAFPFQTASASSGSALLAGAKLTWQGGPWHVDAALHDAGWLRWRGQPRQDAVLDSATAAVDADGFLIYRPLIQGQNRQDTRLRAAPWWTTLDARGRIGAGTLRIGADVLPGFGALPWLGWQQDFGSAEGALLWRAHERRLTLQWRWRGLALSAGTDGRGGGARSRELALAWRLPI
ncbi:MAG: hypothetical protein Q8N44_08235 [Rubrivivax sp.]|nr:hypothetical protein [Rubrivivax sp.]